MEMLRSGKKKRKGFFQKHKRKINEIGIHHSEVFLWVEAYLYCFLSKAIRFSFGRTKTKINMLSLEDEQ